MAWKYVLIVGASCLVTFTLTPWIRAVSIRLRFVARPREERWGRRLVAKCGGIAIYVGMAVGLGLGIPWNEAWIACAAAGTLLMLWGVADDVWGLKPPVKILGQVIAASILVGAGIRIESLPTLLSIPLTIFWIVMITNALNLLDNMDGLACGTAAISSVVLFFCSEMVGNVPVAMASLAMAGACVGFLPHNFHPAKIYMGDCGSMLLGLTLAALSVQGTWGHASNLFLVLLVPVLVLGVPVFDTVFVTITRRLSGRAIWRGGTDHTSHRLVFLGLPERRAVLMLYAISACLGVMTFLVLRLNPYIGSILAFLAVGVVIMFGVFLGHLPIYHIAKDGASDASDRVQVSAAYPYKRRIVEVLLDIVLICAAYFIAYVIRFEGSLGEAHRMLMVQSLPLVIPIQLASFFACGVYGGIWRYVGMRDLVNLGRGVFFGTVFSVLALLLRFRFVGYSRAVFVTDGLVLMMLMASSRMAFRFFREYLANTTKPSRRRAIIVGAGDAGEFLLRELKNNRTLDCRAVGFIDDDPSKIGRRIHGVPVLGNRWALQKQIEQLEIDEVFVAIPSTRYRQAVEEISQICEGCGVRYRHMRSMIEWGHEA